MYTDTYIDTARRHVYVVYTCNYKLTHTVRVLGHRFFSVCHGVTFRSEGEGTRAGVPRGGVKENLRKFLPERIR